MNWLCWFAFGTKPYSQLILAERRLVRMGNKCSPRFAFVTVYLGKRIILFFFLIDLSCQQVASVSIY